MAALSELAERDAVAKLDRDRARPHAPGNPITDDSTSVRSFFRSGRKRVDKKDVDKGHKDKGKSKEKDDDHQEKDKNDKDKSKDKNSKQAPSSDTNGRRSRMSANIDDHDGEDDDDRSALGIQVEMALGRDGGNWGIGDEARMGLE
jgi:hypothetical protein